MKAVLLSLLPRPWIYVLMGLAVLEFDLLTGRFLMFPILFVIPVMLSAWFVTVRHAFALAIFLPLGRLYIAIFFHHPAPPLFLEMNALIRIGVLSLLAYLVARTARQTKELQHEVKELEGILNICMYCKRIKDEHENWQWIENYIAQHSKADFSHGMCMECAQKHHPEVFGKKPCTHSDYVKSVKT